MTEHDAFELRLEAAVHGYVGRIASDLDPGALAHRIATSEPRRRGSAATLPWRAAAIPRIAWLLLLLAVLLPFRGALAAGMLCPGGSGVQAEAQLMQHAHSLQASVVGEEHRHHEISVQASAPVHGHAGSAAHDHDAADKCNLCSAFCSVTGLVSADVMLAEPQSVPAVFPHLCAPAPSFISDGQERPPRSI